MPTGLHAFLSISLDFKCRMTKVDEKMLFMQTASADRDVHVVSPREMHEPLNSLWLSNPAVIRPHERQCKTSSDFRFSLARIKLIPCTNALNVLYETT